MYILHISVKGKKVNQKLFPIAEECTFTVYMTIIVVTSKPI